MLIRIKQTKNMSLITQLNNEIMPSDNLLTDDKTVAWICYVDGIPAGFCTLRKIGSGIVYLDRGGVFSKYRGNGIHRRLISVRERFAKKLGATKVITYTMPDNYASMFTLVRCNYLRYKPEYPWVGSGVVYFIKVLK